MNKRLSFYRKLAYGLGIAILLYPLAILSRPATVTDPDGGTLSRMRNESGLSQANLGEIDPASETMKLATLGLRGLAVNLLWGKAEEYKKKEDWTNLTATLEQLALLQPNFITFWKYQSWNVSYNVSVQFDDYRDRYYYVREGIEFLEQGIEKNRENRDIPQLLWDLGWFIGQKIGRADEYVQYRDLFKNDDEFHGDEPPPGSDERDNWLVSKKEYLNGVSAIQDRGKSIGKKSEKIYYSSPAKSQMNYAEAIEEEGLFEKGQAAWVVAAEDWRDFGDRWIEHSTGRLLRLGHEEQVAQSVEELEERLDALAPGLREQMMQEKREQLSSELAAALEKPAEQRTMEEMQLASQAESQIQVSDLEFVERLAEKDPELRKEAGIIARELAEQRTLLIFTQRYKSDSNYDYWELRAEFEQTDTAVEARRKMFEAKQAFTERQAAEEAKQLYEEGFEKWREVLDTFPDLMDPSGTTGDDLLVFVIDYRKVLRSLDQEIPEDFPLWDIIENFDTENEFEEELRERQRSQGNEATEGENPDAASTPNDTVAGESGPAELSADEAAAEDGAAEQGDAEESRDPAETGADESEGDANASNSEEPGAGSEAQGAEEEAATTEADAADDE